MKKLLIILCFLSLNVFSQITPSRTVRIANATTTFDESLSDGDRVWNIATEEQFVATEGVHKDSTLTTASASFDVYVSGNGTDGYIPNWNGTGSILENSPIFTNGTRVGIGTGAIPLSGLLHLAKSDNHNYQYMDTYDDGNQFSVFVLRKSDSDIIGTFGETDDGDILGDLQWQGVDNGGIDDLGALIRVTQVGASGVRVPTKMELITSSSSGFNEGIKINVDGKTTLAFAGTIINAGDSAYAFGNSITNGDKASPISTNSYANLIGIEKRLTIINKAIGGHEMADFFDTIYKTNIVENSISFALLGYNDMRHYGSSSSGLLSFKRELYSMLCWLSTPAEAIILAQNDTIVYTGTWANNTDWGGNIGKYSSTNGSTATFNVYGSVVYIDILQSSTADRNINVTIDGVDYGDYYSDLFVPSIAGATETPYLLIFQNFENKNHEVILTVGGTSGSVYFNWACGNAFNGKGNPSLYVGNTLYMNSYGYTLAAPNWNNGSNAAVDSFNIIISTAVRDLSEHGKNIAFVDALAHYNLTTDVYSDSIHPNNTGHRHIADAFEAEMNSAALAKGKGLNVINWRNTFENFKTTGNVTIGTTANSGEKLNVNGNVLLSGGIQDYLFTNNSTAFAIQSRKSGSNAGYWFFTKDGDGTDQISLEIFGKGTPSSVSNRERLVVNWSTYEYEIFTEAEGTGTLRPLNIYTEGNSGQVYLKTDGNVGIGTTGSLSALSVNGGLHVGGDSDAGDNNILVDGTATISTIAAGVSDYDKFIVSDGGLLKFRTGAELLSDIGGSSTTGTVTSVGFADGTGFTISGSPITSSGSFTFAQDFSEFTDITESTGIKFIVTDPAEKEIAIGNVDLSDFNNNAFANQALSNLSSVAINTALLPGTTNSIALGSIAKNYSDLFIGSGGVINWDDDDVNLTLTQSANMLTLAGGSFSVGSNNVWSTGFVGRDTDNRLDWSTDDHLKIKIAGTERDIVSISTGAADNDKFITQGYADDVSNSWKTWTGASRTSDATITSTTNLTVGTPIRYRATAGTWRYAVIYSISANVHTIKGTSCTTSDDDEFQYGNPELVIQETFHVDGAFADAATTVSATAGMLYNDLNMKFHYIWKRPKAYLVQMTVACMTADATTDPTINTRVSLDNSTYTSVFGSNIDVDISLHDTGATAVNTTYDLDYDDNLDFSMAVSGTGDAKDITIFLTFVLE